MSLPTSLSSTRMTDATTGDQVDNKVAELEQAIADILGIPIDTPITRAMPISVGASAAEPNISSTAVQTTVHIVSIPGGTLGTDGMLEGFCDLYVNSILTGSTLEIRAIYGGQLIAGLQLANNTGSTQLNFGVRVNFRLLGRGTTNTQRASVSMSIGADQSLLSWGGTPSHWNITRSTFPNVDSTINQNFQIDVIWSSASAGNSVNGEGFEIHKLR